MYYAHSEDTDDALGQLQALLDPYTSRGLQSSIIAAPGEFSRGRGLELGAEHVTDENALLFFVDVDMSVVIFLIFWLRHVLVQSSIEVEPNCSLRFGLSPHRHRAHTARSGRGVEVFFAAVLLPTLILSSSRNGDCDWSSVFFVFYYRLTFDLPPLRTFDEKFLHRCRSNPVPGRTVYYPTVFSLYENHVSIAGEMQNAGLWREAGFGMVCLYRKDFFALGGFDKKIEGWGQSNPSGVPAFFTPNSGYNNVSGIRDTKPQLNELGGRTVAGEFIRCWGWHSYGSWGLG